MVLLAGAFFAAVATPAAAELPRLISAVLNAGSSEGRATLAVTAVDPAAPLSGMVVRVRGRDVFGLAACRADFPVRPPEPPFAPGSKVRLTAPITEPRDRPRPALIRLDSGGCAARDTSAAQPIEVQPVPDGDESISLPLLGPPRRIRLRASVAVAQGRRGPPCPFANRQPGRSRKSLGRARKAIRCLVNRMRRRHGRRALRANPRLARAAFLHSKRMVAQRFFAHVAPGGAGLEHRLFSSSYLKPGLRRYHVGENIGAARVPYAAPAAMVRSWRASSAHRANMLDPLYRSVGVGVAPGTPSGGRGVTYTTNFGMRRVR